MKRVLIPTVLIYITALASATTTTPPPAVIPVVISEPTIWDFITSVYGIATLFVIALAFIITMWIEKKYRR